MLIQDVMSRAVKSVSPETSLQEVASLMCLQRFSSIPVIDSQGILTGVIAERDILKFLFPDIKDLMESPSAINFQALEQDYRKIFSMTAAELMSKQVISVTPDYPLLKAVAVMARHNFRRIPVTQEGVLVGMVSMGDIHRATFIKSFSGSPQLTETA
ncbi:CBS domain-containing protein [Dongshaea marina]|uniref:CBS domain-containing protein n=1 Tax=Dongshaea marina TaxID=2047966 RepID=UPI000D3E3E37|nr:CBS domain-containing protein [Dongshaea marina]